MNILNEIKFDDKGLVPAIAQDYKTGEVLMMAYMDREAVEKTLSSGKAHYFSRSRNKLWLKGETSGHFQHIRGIYYDCDVDTILLKVEQVGAACHTGERSCFYREIETPFKKEIPTSSVLEMIYRVIIDRRSNPKERSYVSSLFSKGTDSILKKIGEEASELLISGKGGKREEVVYEMADLWFHSLVLLGQMDIGPEEVYGELQRRFGTSGIEEKEGRSKKEGN
ncbi:MAG TPA: bifunctional phosphoribosyl-AMP cyclohydrolase/phosphoribosyl-ATP diphosphatase HisIE [Thermodesulfobacteriota bacterium]|nr:bifunctional phosphoribosyl-AMP cyclohydrolase/phosphoribosyl-ATP diphosphatase HisIE [Thermodesulfobacteriota bacterium]